MLFGNASSDDNPFPFVIPETCPFDTSLDDPEELTIRPRVEHLERELIARALNRTGRNHTQAAKLLGLSRYGLLKKMQRYDQKETKPQ